MCGDHSGEWGNYTIILASKHSPDARDQSNEFANRILTADIDTVIFVTGVGVQTIIEQASKNVDYQRFLDCLADIHTIAGSQAAATALRQFEVTPKNFSQFFKFMA